MSSPTHPPLHPHPNLFTCTFCWHLSRGPPRVLGRSARLACDPCYRGLVDLAVCWACGELVVRADECVSLGWCFWHRACYGCLFCGSRKVVTAPGVGELFKGEERDGGEGEGMGRGRAGREISDVPACANCVVECGIDRVDREKVVRNALRRVEKTDGGLARLRWERRREGQMSKWAVGEIRRVPSAVSKDVQNPPLPSPSRLSSHGQLYTSHTSHPPVDGAQSGSGESGEDGGDCVVPLDSVIYVSIFDPFGEPSFKPSPTKPIPKWMQWLPSQRDLRRRSKPRPHSILDEHFPPNPIMTTKNPLLESYTVCPTSFPQDPSYSATTPRPSPRHHKPPSPEFSNITESTIKALKGPSFVLDEPLRRPSSRIAQSKSTSPKSAKCEPLAPPNPHEDLSPRNRTPFAFRQPSPLAWKKKKNARLGNMTVGPGPTREARTSSRSPSPLADQVAAHLQRYVRRTPPAQSREFINLYRPIQPSNAEANNPSAAVPGRRRDRGVGDGRQIWSILDRDRTPSPEGGGRSGQVVLGTGEVVDARSARKRSGLQSELMRVLGGATGRKGVGDGWGG